MNTLKRTLALVATLAMAATAFASCGDKNDSSAATSDTTSQSDNNASNNDGNSDANSTPVAPSTTKSEEVGAFDSSLKNDGTEFTVAAWNAQDVPYLIAQWKGLEYTGDATGAKDVAENKISGIKFINFDCGGGDASEHYDQLFTAGSDLDVYFCEADWALAYINDDSKTLDLAKLGFSDDNFADIYGYTDTIGKDKNGVRKGVSWQAAAGGFAYRADLAEKYLGVKSPEEMQAKIGTWDGFTDAAVTIAEASKAEGQTVALVDSLGGLWQAYACGRTQPWVKDGSVLVDDFCKNFAETAKTLWDNGGVAQVDQWDPAWTAAGEQGTTMGYFASTWGFGGFVLDAAGGKDGAQYGKWALCQGPQSFYWGGTWIVANPALDNAQDAQDFIKSATVVTESMKTYAKNKPEYVNNTVAMDDLISSNTVFNPDITGNFVNNQNIYATLAENAKQINFNGLITEYDATCKTNFIKAVKEQYLVGGKTYDDAVEAFKDLISAEYEDLNVE